MTDRELLELAAKAAGLVGECHLLTGDYIDQEEPGGFRYQHQDGGHEWWNPLTDDGDALRLAARLGIQFHLEGDGDDEIVWANEVSAYTNGNAFDATRRVIVLAAAEIGKSLNIIGCAA